VDEPKELHGALAKVSHRLIDARFGIPPKSGAEHSVVWKLGHRRFRPHQIIICVKHPAGRVSVVSPLRDKSLLNGFDVSMRSGRHERITRTLLGHIDLLTACRLQCLVRRELGPQDPAQWLMHI
jgi:hypothetical protein